MIEIPRQLAKQEYRFITCGAWNDYRTDNGGEKVSLAKTPKDKGWPRDKHYVYGSVKIEEHIKSGGNYGVLCGERGGGLAVIDADNVDFAEHIAKNLPETFTVKTGSGGKHFYYKIPELEKKIVLKKEGVHFGEVQFTGTFVVGPGSVHENGNTYQIVNDKEVVQISKETLLCAIGPFTDKYDDGMKTAESEYESYRALENFGFDITKVIPLSRFHKLNESEYQGTNPWHGSEGGKNLSVNVVKNVAYCFRCEEGISVIKAIALEEGLIKTCSERLTTDDRKKVFRLAREKYGLCRQQHGCSTEKVAVGSVGEFEVSMPLRVHECNLGYEQTFQGEPSAYSIYEFKFGKGQYPCFLVADPQYKVSAGDSMQYIKAFDSETLRRYFEENRAPNLGFLRNIQNKRFVKGKTRQDLLHNIITEQDLYPFFFYVASPLSKEMVEQFQRLSSEQINEIVDYYLTEGNEVDSRIMMAARVNFLGYPSRINSIEPHKFLMPFSPHGLYQTQTKTGKSTVFEKVGVKRDRMSMAGALGFSTANETNRGDIDGINESYTIDEVLEENKEKIIQQVITLLETGKVIISVGRRSVITESCATMNFCSNPKEMNGPLKNIKHVNVASFQQLLRVITDNYRAFGSRIGLVLFGNDFRYMQGSRFSTEEYRTVGALVRHIRLSAEKTFSDIVLDPGIQEWMNCELPSEYMMRVEKTAEKIVSNEVADFWRGHVEAYRHVRGAAIRLACMAHISDLINKKYDVKKIIDEAERRLPEILNCNLRSLSNMQEATPDVKEEIDDHRLRRCSPDYLRFFVLTMLKHIDMYPETIGKYVVIDEIKGAFNKFVQRIESSKYSRWNELKGKILSSVTKIRKKLLNDFGISIQETQGSITFFVADENLMKSYLSTKYYKEIVKGMSSQDLKKPVEEERDRPLHEYIE